MVFTGREYELKLLQDEAESEYASLIAIYGRRRVGKTRLIQEAYENIWVFEGVEGLSQKKQLQKFMFDLSENTGNQTYALNTVENWSKAFAVLHKVWLEYDKPAILFDEVQWMANFRQEFVSLLKAAWERYWSLDKKAVFVLCGSVSSFMTQKVIASNALYQRITTTIKLEPLTIQEVRRFIAKRRSNLDICELYMVLGGIPKYLEYINPKESIELNLNRLCFSKNGKLSTEYEALFHCHFKDAESYQSIIAILHTAAGLSYKDIANRAGIKGGGALTRLLNNLEESGFIEQYRALGASSKTRNLRYRIIDEYLIFYLKFIQVHSNKIKANSSGQNLFRQSNIASSYEKWKGLAFERLCYKHSDFLAEKLGFSSVVYTAGSYFQKKQTGEAGFQIDLLFMRDDRVLTLCEVKYYKGKVGLDVMEACKSKAFKLSEYFPEYSIDPVLITSNGASKALLEEGYFSKVLTVEDFFS